ncbi:MAG TPA: restriction endonuclease subunit S [Frateuria sp.]|uniref:restriction endonuclease subunit S n=1 Tax=Frateuria sp. TaxID=2211372 RepID=UPI002DE77D50|nr:restriction endonuclease subunit S [Frateuria sp.]
MSLPRYPEYKDSGIPLLGSIPAHWSAARLKEVIRSIESGVSVNATDVPAAEDAIGVLKTSCVYDGTFRCKENKAVVEEDLSRVSCPVAEGTLIVSRMNTPPLVGAAGLVTQSHPNIYLPDRLWQVSLRNSSPNFVHYWTLSGEYRAQVEVACSGTSSSMQNLGQDQFRNFQIALPLEDEQHAIATFLDRETAKIDALIAEQEKLLALLAEKRQATISHAVTRGLNPNASMRDSGIPWLGEVPAHWLIGGLTKFIGPVVDYRGRTPAKGDAGTFLVTAKNVRNGAIDYAASEEYVDPVEANALLSRGRPEVGDVLFTTEAPLGQVAQIDRTDIALAQRIVKFRGLEGVLINRFLMYWLMGSACQSQLETLATGSTALGIKASKLGMIECLVPPIPEQQKIVGHIDRQLSQFIDLEVEAVRGIDLLRERRSALISAAVTGKIDVRGAV